MGKRSQGSPRGLLAKFTFNIPEGKGLLFDDYSNRTNLVTASSTGIKVRGGIILATDASSALPTAEDKGIAMQLVSNSTGVGVAINTTGTTWKWLHTTADLNV